MRFFAGFYFLFRLTINVAYLATKGWLEQFVVQQIACVIMVTLLAVCWPYNKENNLFNYVDILIFTDLAILSALSFYMYTVSLNGLPPHPSAFIVQYVLVFLPLVYMLAYIIWYLVTSRNLQWLKERLLRRLKIEKHDYKPLSEVSAVRNTGFLTRTELAVDDLHADEDEALFARAVATNRYHQGNHQDNMDEDTRGTGMSSVLLHKHPCSLSHEKGVSNGYGTMSSSNPSSLINSSLNNGQLRVSRSDEEDI